MTIKIISEGGYPSSTGLVLPAGEVGIDTVTGAIKVGDGVTSFASLNPLPLQLGATHVTAATTPGTVAKKIEVFDAAGVSLGFVAVYDAIT